jgi:putative IMPACT (imprinted ancient) family translation regulator
VVRYFGGTKLGTSGLIRAYKTAAEEAISNTKIIKKTIKELYEIQFDYNLMNDVMKILHDEEIEPIEKNFEASCSFILGIKKSSEQQTASRFDKVNGLNIKKLNKTINT